jgi:hypothetical protein
MRSWGAAVLFFVALMDCGSLAPPENQGSMSLSGVTPRDSSRVNRHSDSIFIVVDYNLGLGNSLAVIGLEFVCTPGSAGFLYIVDTLRQTSGTYRFGFVFDDFSMTCNYNGIKDFLVIRPEIVFHQSVATVKTLSTAELHYFADTLDHITPAGVIIGALPKQMLIHPSKPYVYLTEGNYAAPDSIVMIDYDHDSIVKRIAVDGDVGYGALGNNGNGFELYLPATKCCSTFVSSGGTNVDWTYGGILVCDAEDLSMKKRIDMGGGTITSCVSSNTGFLFISSDFSLLWPFGVYSFLADGFIPYKASGYGYPNSNCRLAEGPSGLDLIAVTFGLIPAAMQYVHFTTACDTLTTDDCRYHGDYPLAGDLLKVCGAKGYLITSTSGVVYTADAQMLYKGTLGYNDFYDFAFSASGDTILAASRNSRQIYRYSYPGLLRIDSLQTAGYPFKMERAGNRLIIISQTARISSAPTPVTFLEKLEL